MDANFTSTNLAIRHQGIPTNLESSQLLTVTGVSTIDASDLHSDVVELTAGSAQDITTISNGRHGQKLYLFARSTSSAITLKYNTGNLLMLGAADVALSNIRAVMFIYDANQSKWIANL
jgi:hypothetical protein